MHHFCLFITFIPCYSYSLGMATGQVRAGFLHTRTRLAGQDLRPGPGPIINRVFFSGPRPAPSGLAGPVQPLGLKSGPTNFFLSPLRFFARFKPIQAIYGSQFKPIEIFFVLRFLAFGPRYMAAKSIQIICSQINPNHRLIINQ